MQPTKVLSLKGSIRVVSHPTIRGQAVRTPSTMTPNAALSRRVSRRTLFLGSSKTLEGRTGYADETERLTLLHSVADLD